MLLAICDDEKDEVLHLQTLVQEFDTGTDILTFTSAKCLLDGAQSHNFDIVLLDINMDDLNGFTAAKMLASMENPPLVVFVTNSGEYVFRGYEVAFDYLQKPVNYDTLARTLTRAVKKITPQRIIITAEGDTHTININEILYIEAYKHCIHIHTVKRELASRMLLSDITAMLPINTFVTPHKGYLVNLNCVDKLGQKVLTLTSGKEIPVSRRQRQSFEQALFHFLRRGVT